MKHLRTIAFYHLYDLPDNMTNLCKMFADDTKIIVALGILLQNDVQAAARMGRQMADDV